MAKSVKIFSILFLSFCIQNCSKDKSEETAVNNEDQTTDISENKKNVGASANDMLSNENFNSIEFELVYVSGMKPSTTTISNFETFLNERLNKSGGINIELKEIEITNKETYSITEVRTLEDEIRTKYNDGNKLSVFGIFLDGAYDENTDNGSVLGVAYRNTSFVIFEETIKQFSGRALAPSTSVLETTVLNHEFGHLLGLVNAGTTPQSDHQDEVHGRHCTTEDCLMYWTAETGEGLLNSISGGTIPSLDELCIQDLRSNGGK